MADAFCGCVRLVAVSQSCLTCTQAWRKEDLKASLGHNVGTVAQTSSSTLAATSTGTFSLGLSSLQSLLVRTAAQEMLPVHTWFACESRAGCLEVMNATPCACFQFWHGLCLARRLGKMLQGNLGSFLVILAAWCIARSLNRSCGHG